MRSSVKPSSVQQQLNKSSSVKPSSVQQRWDSDLAAIRKAKWASAAKEKLIKVNTALKKYRGHPTWGSTWKIEETAQLENVIEDLDKLLIDPTNSRLMMACIILDLEWIQTGLSNIRCHSDNDAKGTDAWSRVKEQDDIKEVY
jgi:hypothetical protein